MSVLENYYVALDKRAQEERQKALAAKGQEDERAHSLHLMQESMLGDMLRQMGRVQHEGKRPNMLENLIAQLKNEEERLKAYGDFDAADRARIKRETVLFALECLKEEEKKHGMQNLSKG